MNLLGKYIINCKMVNLTGLHIGAVSDNIDIGGIDNAVIKDPITKNPYIPGSSIKGKIRSNLEWANNKVTDGKPCACKDLDCIVCNIFGSTAKNTVRRLIIRDAFPTNECLKMWREENDNLSTELKAENTINRITSHANPRNIERVIPFSEFSFDIIVDKYDEDNEKYLKEILKGLVMLEDSYLGGGGSRGNGKVVFNEIAIKYRDVEEFYKNSKDEKVEFNKKIDLEKIRENQEYNSIALEIFKSLN